MLRNTIYYNVKPFIPREWRMMIRRRMALRQRKRFEHVWPIMPGSERPPIGWPGWPDGKKFAVVLTHDVETRAGLEKCGALMRLEQKMGFRSCFNLIPKGAYRVPAALRQEMAQNGFEVGLHDLRHDGRLFLSASRFQRDAIEINRFLREWNSVGFRSGFMLHNLNWLHQLDIEYDLSTFDTDPFEPQPEGRHTIFPFWIARPPSKTSAGVSREGYVELPYTLPQDSTLFLLLRERTIDIWQQKLRWIAAHGGMALVNIHPDYLCFENERASNRSYPVEHYRLLLEHLRQDYGGTFWQPLPGQVADFVKNLEPRPTSHRLKQVCMVTHSFYESDNRVTRYAEALAARGDRVDVFALRRSPELPQRENIKGVNIFRVQDRFGKNERSKFAYLWPLLRFLRISSRWVTQHHVRKRYDFVHVHNVPDFLIFSAWYPKLTGARIILDIHDIVPEFFESKFRMRPGGVFFTLLQWMERASAAFADHVIVANHLWLKKYAVRTRTMGRCSAFINNVDSSIFSPRLNARSDGKFVILFPGGLQWHQGVDIAVRAFKKVSEALPNAEFHIYGDGSAKESLVTLAETIGLGGKVFFFKPMSVREIARVMASADLGVVPKRADSFGNEAYSTKIMEFMSVGVPVVVSRTKIDLYYFDDSVVRFFDSGDTDALAHEILSLLQDSQLRRLMVARATEYAARNCWENCKHEYLNLVDSLCDSSIEVRVSSSLQAAA
jgi:glycosyltransferase involved in cell wall biosynthesis/peptidoglycan/xylan/chitin deacetylase (PgdA/CDA1 family)